MLPLCFKTLWAILSGSIVLLVLAICLLPLIIVIAVIAKICKKKKSKVQPQVTETKASVEESTSEKKVTE